MNSPNKCTTPSLGRTNDTKRHTTVALYHLFDLEFAFYMVAPIRYCETRLSSMLPLPRITCRGAVVYFCTTTHIHHPRGSITGHASFTALGVPTRPGPNNCKNTSGRKGRHRRMAGIGWSAQLAFHAQGSGRTPRRTTGVITRVADAGLARGRRGQGGQGVGRYVGRY